LRHPVYVLNVHARTAVRAMGHVQCSCSEWGICRGKKKTPFRLFTSPKSLTAAYCLCSLLAYLCMHGIIYYCTGTINCQLYRPKSHSSDIGNCFVIVPSRLLQSIYRFSALENLSDIHGRTISVGN